MATKRKSPGGYKQSRHTVGDWKVLVHAGKGGVLWEATSADGEERQGDLPFLSAKDALADAREVLRGPAS